MNASITDRRKESRVYVRFPATICWKDNTDEEIIEQSYTIDMSASGAGLTSRKPIPVGHKVQVTIDVGGPTGSSWAEVKWSSPINDVFKVGLSFRV